MGQKMDLTDCLNSAKEAIPERPIVEAKVSPIYYQNIVEFNTDISQGRITQMPNPRTQTYTIDGFICNIPVISTSMRKGRAINDFFFDNQKKLNNMISLVLEEEGIKTIWDENAVADCSGKYMLSVGSQSHYYTNVYNLSPNKEFHQLVNEELGICRKFMCAFYAVMQYVIETGLSQKEVKEVPLISRTLPIVYDPLILSFINRDATIDANRSNYAQMMDAKKLVLSFRRYFNTRDNYKIRESQKYMQ